MNTNNLQFRVFLTLFCIFLIVYREPALLLFPRLWAEEGTIFYHFARTHSVWEIFTTIHVGYLTLFNSIVSSLQTKIFTVEAAAKVSTYLGLCVQFIPVYIIIFTNHPFWVSPFKKIIYAITFIIVTPAELWVNTTNSHFIFGLITFLIMLTPTTTLSRINKYLFRMLLFVGGLTGPASILFTPVYFIKAYRDKNKEKYIQTIIITICSIIQGSIILYCLLFNNRYQRLTKHNFRVTFFAYCSDNFSMIPHDYTFTNTSTYYLYLFLGILIATFFIYLVIKNRNKDDYMILFMSFIIVSVCSTLGSLDMSGANRYSYIPTCLIILIMVSEIIATKNQYITRYVSIVLLVFVLMINARYYFRSGYCGYLPSFPKWKVEVAKWRANPNYNPQIHPNGWKVKLTP
jgi:hypothetical protein